MAPKQLVIGVFALAILGFAAEEASAYYAPHLGRFLSRDPAGSNNVSRIGLAAGSAITHSGGRLFKRYKPNDDPMAMAPYHDGMNMYQYVKSAPTNYFDPSGMYLWGGVGTPHVHNDPPKHPRDGTCLSNCLFANGVPAAVGVGIGVSPTVSLPLKPPGRPLGAPTPDYSTLLRKYGGKSCRVISRRLNPASNIIAAATLPYSAAATMSCSAICSSNPFAY